MTEIVEVRARRGRVSRHDITRRLSELEKNWPQFKVTPLNVGDLMPIRAVTLLEVFTRQWVAEMIDAGEPYVARAASWKKDLRFDTSVWLAMHGKRVTLGELFSHQLSINSLADVESVVSALLGHSLFEQMKSVYSREQVEIYRRPKVPIVSDMVQLRKSLVRLFEVRHIIVHELPEQSPLTAEETDGFPSAALTFALAADEVLERALYGEVPLTQFAMNQHAGASLRQVEQELADTIVEFDLLNVEGFQGVLAAFEAYANAHASWSSGVDEPLSGSIAPLLFAGDKEAILRGFISQLKRRTEYLAGR
ncbi:hypothetical protein HUW63_30070 [Myxococcus sp. AM001]|nr:hypothetical protein [Myxococcus sp. AM001]